MGQQVYTQAQRLLSRGDKSSHIILLIKRVSTYLSPRTIPHQQNPPRFTERQKKLWRESIKTVFGNSYAREERQLHVKFFLGPWTYKNIRDEWECFYSAAENRLYLKENDR